MVSGLCQCLISSAQLGWGVGEEAVNVWGRKQAETLIYARKGCQETKQVVPEKAKALN
jgi:hypothetical protein